MSNILKIGIQNNYKNWIDCKRQEGERERGIERRRREEHVKQNFNRK